MFDRLCNIPKSYSFFLFGARGTGKSTLLHQSFANAQGECLWVNLLDPSVERRLSQNPSYLREMIDSHRALNAANPKVVVIDEVQKVPELLNLVHQLIEDSKLTFALTGSSARKLKRGAANLLAGRAFVRRLYPLTHRELGPKFNLDTALTWGSLPRVLQFDLPEDRADFLYAYTDTYLKEEVLMEQLVRKVPAFREFLHVCAQSAGKILNYTKIARDISADNMTVTTYLEILEDTLIANLLPPFHQSIRKRQRKNPKLYFFDIGVVRALANQLNLPLRASTYLYGDLFEQFVILEIMRLAEYYQKKWSFSYLRTKDDAEIDLIIERPGLPLAAIEIKSTSAVDDHEIDRFARLGRDLPNAECFIFSQDSVARIRSGVHCLSWMEGIAAIGL
jgi:predicted AAA+ superfamily ATPase